MTRYGNRTAKPVTVGPRVAARLLDALLVGVVYAISAYIPLAILQSGRFDAMAYVVWLPVIGAVLAVILFVVQLVLVFTRSTTIGGAAARVKYLKTDTGDDAKAMLFVRHLVSGLFDGVTLGIGMISYVVSYREGQHWIDRMFSLVGVEKESVKAAPSQIQAQQPVMQGQSRVTPVRIPQRPNTMPASAVGGPRPAGPGQVAPVLAQPPAGAGRPAVMQPVSGQPAPHAPAQPAPQPARPQGTRPGVAPANPWAFKAEDPAAQPPARQSAPSFAPPGQPEISAHHSQQAVPMPPPAGNSMLSDETVLDPEVAGDDVAAVVLDDGQRITLEVPVVLGRNPVAPASHPGARCITVVDESMRLSKSHLVLAAEEGGVAVFDIGATNGIQLEHDGAKARLAARQSHPLPADAVLHFGGRSLRVAP